MCIYFPDGTPDLSYNNQEHIFPAGLGGKLKLANIIVSDQANKLFSSLEITLIRHSLLSFERAIYGPGKRGSLAPQHASKSPVYYSIETETQKPILSYMSLGKPHTICQFYLCNNKDCYISAPSNNLNNQIVFLHFLTNLKKFNNVFTHILGNTLKENDIIIGYHDKKFYVSTKSVRPSSQEVKNIIRKFLNNFVMNTINTSTNHVSQHFSIVENEEISRIYAKVAINALTYLKGAALTTLSEFNEIKQWILTGKSKTEYFYLPSIVTPDTLPIIKTFPDKSHWCLFLCRDDELVAFVCFYNRYVRQFTLCKIPNGYIKSPIGLICDWQNGMEYTLDKHILNIAQEYNNFEKQ